MVQNVCPNRPEMSSFGLGRELEAIASNYSIQNPDTWGVIAKAIHSWPKERGSYRCGRLPIGGIRKAASIQALQCQQLTQWRVIFETLGILTKGWHGGTRNQNFCLVPIG